MEGLHTQYQQELGVLIDALEVLNPDNDEAIEMRDRLIGMANMLIVRDDLDELVAVAHKLFPDGYKELGKLLSEARTALDDPAGVEVSQEEAELYAINKLDNAITMLVNDEVE